VRATVEDAELCVGIARAAAVAGFRNVFPPGLYEFPDDAIRSDWLSALTDPGGGRRTSRSRTTSRSE
jgi:hypothetical protein